MKLVKIILSILIVSFILNIAWENANAPLYKGFIDYSNHFKMCFDASIGDALLILTMYFLISLILWNLDWIESIKIKDFFLIIVIGLIITIIFEKYALDTGRWDYNEYMPIIPFLGIGLSPILQLILHHI
ncbi:MAG: hypothetical protein PHS49_00435 [Candidatus Gracilibacteria bacterium]|nr:hypothetical protein [Candidatus Gracilibacteria bacterium]